MNVVMSSLLDASPQAIVQTQVNGVKTVRLKAKL